MNHHHLKLLISLIAFSVAAGTSHASTKMEMEPPVGSSSLSTTSSHDRRLTRVSKEKLCNNLELVENGLETHYLDLFEASNHYGGRSYVRYNCECLAEDDPSLKEGQLIMKCTGKGTSPKDSSEAIDLEDIAIFQAITTGNNKNINGDADGEGDYEYYELTTTYWGDSFYEGNTKLPQEIYSYKDGKLDSCQARDCEYCRPCSNSDGGGSDGDNTVEVDCANIGLYFFSCSTKYTGGFLNQHELWLDQMMVGSSSSSSSDPSSSSSAAISTGLFLLSTDDAAGWMMGIVVMTTFLATVFLPTLNHIL